MGRPRFRVAPEAVKVELSPKAQETDRALLNAIASLSDWLVRDEDPAVPQMINRFIMSLIDARRVIRLVDDAAQNGEQMLTGAADAAD